MKCLFIFFVLFSSMSFADISQKNANTQNPITYENFDDGDWDDDTNDGDWDNDDWEDDDGDWDQPRRFRKSCKAYLVVGGVKVISRFRATATAHRPRKAKRKACRKALRKCRRSPQGRLPLFTCEIRR